MEEIEQTIEFIKVADALKGVERKTYAPGRTRHENSAEHSWQLALMALTLAPHANEPVDILRVLKMLIVHDIPEVEVRDTFHYAKHAQEDLAERELLAARKLFGMLPSPIGEEFLALWIEFEERTTPEARFAAALDRTAPMILNSMMSGGSWTDHDITRAMVVERNQHAAEGSSALWHSMLTLLDKMVEDGVIRESQEQSS